MATTGAASVRGQFRKTAQRAYLAEWKRLDEQEQWLFEAWLARQIDDASYVARWRMIDRAFAALESRRMGTTVGAAA